jgi:hypothetical protein
MRCESVRAENIIMKDPGKDPGHPRFENSGIMGIHDRLSNARLYRHFIGISILKGQEKSMEISKEIGRSTEENRTGRD